MGKSQTKAKNKYNAKAYDRISVTVKKGMKDEWKSEADKQGLSLNAFIEQAVNQMIENEREVRYNNLLSVSVEDMELNVRTFNCLYRVGIKTIGDFKKYIQNHKITEIRNLGTKSAIETIDKIKQYEHKYNVSLNIDYDKLMEQIESLPVSNKYK